MLAASTARSGGIVYCAGRLRGTFWVFLESWSLALCEAGLYQEEAWEWHDMRLKNTGTRDGRSSALYSIAWHSDGAFCLTGKWAVGARPSSPGRISDLVLRRNDFRTV